MSSAPVTPFDLVVTLRYATAEEFEAGFAPCVGDDVVFLKTRVTKPVGSLVRAELRLRDGFPALVVTGRVLWSMGPEMVPRGRVAGMGVSVVTVDQSSSARLGRIRTAHGEGVLARAPGATAWVALKQRHPRAAHAILGTGTEMHGSADALHRDLDDAFDSLMSEGGGSLGLADAATASALHDALRSTGREAPASPPLAPPREPARPRSSPPAPEESATPAWKALLATPELPRPPSSSSVPPPPPVMIQPRRSSAPPPAEPAAAPAPPPAPRPTPAPVAARPTPAPVAAAARPEAPRPAPVPVAPSPPPEPPLVDEQEAEPMMLEDGELQELDDAELQQAPEPSAPVASAAAAAAPEAPPAVPAVAAAVPAPSAGPPPESDEQLLPGHLDAEFAGMPELEAPPRDDASAPPVVAIAPPQPAAPASGDGWDAHPTSPDVPIAAMLAPEPRGPDAPLVATPAVEPTPAVPPAPAPQPPEPDTATLLANALLGNTLPAPEQAADPNPTASSAAAHHAPPEVPAPVPAEPTALPAPVIAEAPTAPAQPGPGVPAAPAASAERVPSNAATTDWGDAGFTPAPVAPAAPVAAAPVAEPGPAVTPSIPFAAVQAPADDLLSAGRVPAIAFTPSPMSARDDEPPLVTPPGWYPGMGQEDVPTETRRAINPDDLPPETENTATWGAPSTIARALDGASEFAPLPDPPAEEGRAWRALVEARGQERPRLGVAFTLGFDARNGVPAALALEEVFWPIGKRTHRELPPRAHAVEPATAAPPADAGASSFALGPPPLPKRAAMEAAMAGMEDTFAPSPASSRMAEPEPEGSAVAAVQQSWASAMNSAPAEPADDVFSSFAPSPVAASTEASPSFETPITAPGVRHQDASFGVPVTAPGGQPAPAAEDEASSFVSGPVTDVEQVLPPADVPQAAMPPPTPPPPELPPADPATTTGMMAIPDLGGAPPPAAGAEPGVVPSPPGSFEAPGSPAGETAAGAPPADDWGASGFADAPAPAPSQLADPAALADAPAAPAQDAASTPPSLDAPPEPLPEEATAAGIPAALQDMEVDLDSSPPTPAVADARAQPEAGPAIAAPAGQESLVVPAKAAPTVPEETEVMLESSPHVAPVSEPAPGPAASAEPVLPAQPALPPPAAPGAVEETTVITTRPRLDDVPARPGPPRPSALVHMVGLALPGGRLRKLLSAGDALPAHWSKTVPGPRTAEPLSLEIYESMSERTEDGHALGTVTGHLPGDGASVSDWQVDVLVDDDAVLRVTLHPAKLPELAVTRLFALENTTARGRSRVARQPKDPPPPPAAGGGLFRRLMGR